MGKTTKSSITNIVDKKGGLDPDVVDVTIVPGDDVTVDITATVTKNSSTKQPLDLVFLADLSGSYRDDLPVLRDLVPKIVSSVRDIQPNSQFGLASFIDKPKSPFGGARDFVYQTEEAVTKSRTDFQEAMDGLKIGSGNDGPEAQLEGLMQVALREKEVGYRKNSRRVVVLSTDANYHEAGDGKTAGIRTPNNGDDVLDGKPAGTGEDYPSVEQVKTALQEAGIVPIFAVTGNQTKTYEKLVDKLGFGAVETLSRDSSNLVKVVTDGLEEIFSDLTMVPQSDDFGYVKNIKPATYENVRPGQSRTFEVTLGTKDADAGKDRLSLAVLGYGETVVNVSPVVNTNPVAKDDKLATDAGSKLVIKPRDLLANDRDKDGDKLSISEVGKATNGKVQLAKNGRVIFTPDKDFTGKASFEYTIDDGNKGTASATVTVNVKEPPKSPNSLPKAKDDTVGILPFPPFNTIKPERLLENDSDKDGDKLTITEVSKVTGGKVELAKSGEITFTSDDPSKFAKASFEYAISDGNGGTDTAKVTLEAARDTGDDDSTDIPRDTDSSARRARSAGEASQRFVYDDLLDGGAIADFEVGNDVIVLDGVLDSVGYEGSNAIADEYVRVVSRGANAMVQIDPDGPDGPESFQPFIRVKGVPAEALNDPSNFSF
jgi:hypothetical protein